MLLSFVDVPVTTRNDVSRIVAPNGICPADPPKIEPNEMKYCDSVVSPLFEPSTLARVGDGVPAVMLIWRSVAPE